MPEGYITKVAKSAIVITAMTLQREDRVILPYKKAIAYRLENLNNYGNDNSVQTIRLQRI